MEETWREREREREREILERERLDERERENELEYWINSRKVGVSIFIGVVLNVYSRMCKLLHEY